jgi:hypothetical protein
LNRNLLRMLIDWSVRIGRCRVFQIENCFASV